MKKRNLLALLLALILVLSMTLSAAAQSAEESTGETTEPTSEETTEPTSGETTEETTEATEETTEETTEATEETTEATEETTEETEPYEGPPIITKDPTGETVEEGGTALFVARAEYYDELCWQFLSPGGAEVYPEGIHAYFPNLRVSGDDGTTLTLSNIPLGMDGWKVRCLFSNEFEEDWVKTKSAVIWVTPEATTEPTTEETTEETTGETTEEVTEETTQETTEAPTEETTRETTAPPTAPIQTPPVQKQGLPWWVICLMAVLVLSVLALVALLVLRWRHMLPFDDEEDYQEDFPEEPIVAAPVAPIPAPTAECDKCGWSGPLTNAEGGICPWCGSALEGQDQA